MVLNLEITSPDKYRDRNDVLFENRFLKDKYSFSKY